MKIISGTSQQTDAKIAFEEATKDWDVNKDSLKFILLFHSTAQDPKVLAEEAVKRFPNTPIMGCTTAGEYLNGKRYSGSLVVSGITSNEVRWAVSVATNLSTLNYERASKVANDLMKSLSIEPEDLDPQKHFCLSFIDGLSQKEEESSALFADVFQGIPFLGGSAGDDLMFSQTFVCANGKVYSDAAVIALGESSIPFYVIKHQHFLGSDLDLVVTEVDYVNRKVISFDGKPAAERYAEALNLSVQDLNTEIFSKHPLTFSCNKDIYVRSIQKVEADGSLTFYCAVEEGMVLEMASHRSMEESLQEDISKIRNILKKVDWFIGANCILRSLEASAKNSHENLHKIIAEKLSAKSIAFDTYGEQLNGLHINQTLVGIAFGEAA